MSMRYVTLAAGAAVLMATVTASAQTYDTVHIVGTAPVRGTIVAFSPNDVTIDVPGRGERKIEIHEIRRVTYADDPAGLTRAREALQQGQLEDAMEEIRGVNAAGRAEVQHDVQFYKALAASRLALAGSGSQKQAAAAMLAFVRANSKSYHFYEAAEVLGDLAMALNNPESAAKYYRSLAGAGSAELKLKAAVLTGKAEEAAGDFAEALRLYENVAGSAMAGGEVDRLKSLASVGRATCMAQTGKTAEAIKAVETMIETNDPHQDVELFARAYITLGTCHRKMNQPKDALLDYLHVHILFHRDAEAHAEALFYLTDLWDKVQKPDESMRARNLLKQRYPGSRWAKQLAGG